MKKLCAASVFAMISLAAPLAHAAAKPKNTVSVKPAASRPKSSTSSSDVRAKAYTTTGPDSSTAVHDKSKHGGATKTSHDIGVKPDVGTVHAKQKK